MRLVPPPALRLPARAAALIAALALGPPALAGPRQMLPEAEQAEWLAVGRLNVTGQGYCTATLVAPDLVLTAAHCVVDRRSGRPVDAGRVHFLAGFRAGSYASHGIGRDVVIVPGFDRAASDVAHDIALVRLAAAMDDRVRPIPVAPRLDPARPMAIASYGVDRAQILSTETGCRYRGRAGAVIYTSCEGLPGVSGAPVLQWIGDQWVAVAVASAVVAARKVPVTRGALLASDATLDRLLLLGQVADSAIPGAVFATGGRDVAPAPAPVTEPATGAETSPAGADPLN